MGPLLRGQTSILGGCNTDKPQAQCKVCSSRDRCEEQGTCIVFGQSPGEAWVYFNINSAVPRNSVLNSRLIVMPAKCSATYCVLSIYRR